MLRIIQLTDMHMGGEDDFPLGVDLRANFVNTLEKIKEEQADHLMLTGDFCLKKPLAEVYALQKKAFDTMPMAYSCLPGNHDDKSMMIHTFGLNSTEEEEIFGEKIIEGHKVLSLDTAVGQMSDRQKEWLTQKLSGPQSTYLVFMHHPPTLGGIPHMDDAHAMRDHKEVWDIFQESKKEIFVFCGHYHTDRSIHQGSVHLFFTPSLYLQIHDAKKHFQVEHYRPGYRVIQYDGKRLQTKVRYIEGKRF